MRLDLVSHPATHPCMHKPLKACRSHKDLAKDAAPYFRKGRKFYDGLALQLTTQGHSLDVYACSLDQVGRSRGAEGKTGLGWPGGRGLGACLGPRCVQGGVAASHLVDAYTCLCDGHDLLHV